MREILPVFYLNASELAGAIRKIAPLKVFRIIGLGRGEMQ